MYNMGGKVEKIEAEAWASPPDSQTCFPCFVHHLRELGLNVLEIDETRRRVKVLAWQAE